MPCSTSCCPFFSLPTNSALTSNPPCSRSAGRRCSGPAAAAPCRAPCACPAQLHAERQRDAEQLLLFASLLDQGGAGEKLAGLEPRFLHGEADFLGLRVVVLAAKLGPRRVDDGRLVRCPQPAGRRARPAAAVAAAAPVCLGCAFCAGCTGRGVAFGAGTGCWGAGCCASANDVPTVSAAAAAIAGCDAAHRLRRRVHDSGHEAIPLTSNVFAQAPPSADASAPFSRCLGANEATP